MDGFGLPGAPPIDNGPARRGALGPRIYRQAVVSRVAELCPRAVEECCHQSRAATACGGLLRGAPNKTGRFFC